MTYDPRPESIGEGVAAASGKAAAPAELGHSHFSRMQGRQQPAMFDTLLSRSCPSAQASLGLHVSVDTDASQDSPLAPGAQGALGGRVPPCLLQGHCLHRLFLPGEGKQSYITGSPLWRR